MHAPDPVPDGRPRSAVLASAAEGASMSDKSPRQSASKKSVLSIKEKRAAKKGKKDKDGGTGVISGK